MDFVNEHSIVRKIWGNTDVILFIFAGAAAEFSLNKAVDWLYFTGKLPKDPLGRLFSTVAYAQKIVFSPLNEANAAIDQITMIHKHVEGARNTKIPDWAYRDVLFMLIDYSIRSFEVLERKLNLAEKEEIFNTFYLVGQRMEINGLPTNFTEWQSMHELQLHEDLVYSHFSQDLFSQYKKHLGFSRFFLMRKIQALIVPVRVNELLQLGKGKLVIPILALYKLSRGFNLHKTLRNLILPAEYKAQILDLEIIKRKRQTI
ncbi:oxygenase MpaB family protein [Pedobacter punctiformis]|uniref:Oxygenase MpaB family protein n=1 Tax=Pedobacter punctiformis TaxID=3004097 RepID=A0ABT4L8B8_9SPHI|nr:oxygenase MpaB family protein [Pedobacter sp. HCMS5-2]MCZ4244168.1 oxygenase MpaB family protein [Pedobacter sp. HCMS5-2]